MWNASTINGSRQRRNGILNNELYTGTITYNRQRFVKDPETGKRTSRLNPEHEWVKTDVPALRIIDDETWNKVQAIWRRGNRCGGHPAVRLGASTTKTMGLRLRKGFIPMSKRKIYLALITPEMSREEARQRLIAALRRSGLEIKPPKGVG